MVSYILKIKNVQGEEFTYTYEDSKAFFYKRANIGFANERYPQNFELVEPIYEREDSAQVKSMYNHILEHFTSYDEPLTFTIDDYKRIMALSNIDDKKSISNVAWCCDGTFYYCLWRW